ncbi:MAG: hypothetical protein IPN76_17415 [Saprospiraceae bacterium]|nr:hypothetical protein [Saprospiraceae bacterium]
MESNRKHLMDKFFEHLNQSFGAWCSTHEMPNSEDCFLTFLIDQDLIPPTNILRYTVQLEMSRLCKENSLQKTHNVEILAHRFNLSERTIWNILKHANTTNLKQQRQHHNK